MPQTNVVISHTEHSVVQRFPPAQKESLLIYIESVLRHVFLASLFLTVWELVSANETWPIRDRGVCFAVACLNLSAQEMSLMRLLSNPRLSCCTKQAIEFRRENNRSGSIRLIGIALHDWSPFHFWAVLGHPPIGPRPAKHELVFIKHVQLVPIWAHVRFKGDLLLQLGCRPGHVQVRGIDESRFNLGRDFCGRDAGILAR